MDLIRTCFWPTALWVKKRNVYQYKPLPSHAIRLLHLLPADEQSDPIRCELSELRLDESSHQPNLYEALSYTWGGDDKSCSIVIQNNTIAITANLHEALVRLRHNSLPRILWVDAICIDQSNLFEKQTQIPLMYSIYARASSVLVWLGEGLNRDGQAFDDLCATAAKRAANPNHEQIISEGIYLLLQHSWFQRIWVLQEVAAARRVQILRGHSGIDGYAFCLAIDSLQNSLRSDERYQQIHRTVRPITYLIRQSTFRPIHRSPATTSHGHYLLGELVDMFHTHQASISSDKIYALISMSSDGSEQLSLTPNYTLPFHEVLKRLVEYLFPGQITVSIQQDRAAAVIKGRGLFIGRIGSVKSITTSNQQTLQVFWNDSATPGWDHNWEILASAVSVQPNDLIYLFHGTLTPVILRIQSYVPIILATTISLPLHDTNSFLKNLCQMHQRPLTMVWDWDYSPDDLDRVRSYNLWTRTRSREVPSSEADINDKLDDLRQLADLALDLYAGRFPEIADGQFSQWIQRCNTQLTTIETQTSNTSLHAVLREHIRNIFTQAPTYIRDESAFWAYEQGHLALFSTLLDTKQVFLSIKGQDWQTIFQLAIERGDRALIEELLPQEADIDRRFQVRHKVYWTGLQYAAGAGHLAIVERLLLANADVNIAAAAKNGRTALQAAAEGGHLAVVERLLLANADVNAAAGIYQGKTALQAAAGGGHLALVERLLLANADANAKAGSIRGRTALQAAAEGVHLAVIERLLLADADVNAKIAHEDGRPALQAAAGGGHLAIVERLLLANADVNAKAGKFEGRAALQAAAEGGHLAVVERLLHAGADINAVGTYDDRTALQAAVEGGHVAIVKRLQRAQFLRTEDITPMAWH